MINTSETNNYLSKLTSFDSVVNILTADTTRKRHDTFSHETEINYTKLNPFKRLAFEKNKHNRHQISIESHTAMSHTNYTSECYRNVQQHNVMNENSIEKRTFFRGGRRSHQRRQSYRGRFVRATKFSGRPHLFRVVSILCRVIIQRSIVGEN